MNIAFIFGDSRLENMQTHINDIYNGNLPIYVEKYNGKGLHFLTTEVLECLKIYPTARIIMAGGICDCSHRPNRLVNFRCTFTSMSEMSEDIMALFYDSNNIIRTEYPGARVCYSELISMDLLEYKNIDNPFPGQQDIFYCYYGYKN